MSSSSAIDPAQLALATEVVRPNLVKQTMAAGQLATSFGLRVAFSVEMPLIAKRAGYTAILMNMEHMAIGMETMSNIAVSCLNVGITPMVVVPTCTQEWISRCLDSGAQCVIVPHVNNKAEALICANAAKFPPIGKRSVTMVTAMTQYSSGIGYRAIGQVVNENVMIMPMIETEEGVANVEEIASTPGIDCLLIGCADLSMELGIPQEYDSEKFMSTIDKIAKAAAAAGITIGLGGLEPYPAKIEEIMLKYSNVRFVMAGRDMAILLAGMNAQVAQCKALNAKLQAAAA
ncbi:hypothetical protein IAT38_005583 [Cryptococcus sp. DSM 104549]